MTVKVLHPRDSSADLADWLESVAATIRERGESFSAKAIVIVDRSTSRDWCQVGFFSSPAISSPIEAVGMIELGKYSYISQGQ